MTKRYLLQDESSLNHVSNTEDMMAVFDILFEEPQKPKPKPIESKFTTDVSLVDRKVWCARYDECLDVAIERKWKGFTCDECEAYEASPPMSVEEAEEDAARCRALLAVVDSGRIWSRPGQAIAYQLEQARGLTWMEEFQTNG